MERAGGGCAMVLSAPIARRPREAGGEQAGADIEACVPGTRATPSTIALSAIFRALEDARPRATRRIADPFARAFVDARLRAVVALGALLGASELVCDYIDRRWPGARTSTVARTSFIDDRADAAVAAGIGQIVLLGAGYDTRAYRLRG
jgi:methyltransferase (TIGR00027 family)